MWALGRSPPTSISVRAISSTRSISRRSANVEARRQWFVGGLDAVYVSLGGAKAVVFRGDTGSFNLKIEDAIITPFVGYSVGNATWTLDILGGTRYWSMNAD